MVVGIDLGTSNTVLATISRDGAPVIIPDAGNKNLLSTPTRVLIDNNHAFAGGFAENLFELYPQKKLLSFFKRHFGTGIPVYTDEQQNAWFSETLAALVLKKVIFDAEMYLHDGFEKLVLTVPAHYNDIQRKSVYEAARLANLEINSIIDEPVAAALSYGFNKSGSEELTLVYDFGGGTFDLTLITQNNNQLHVIAKDGIEKLGGKEFDEIIAVEIRNAYQRLFHEPFPADPLSENRLQRIAEQLKISINKNELPITSEWILIGRNAFECRIPSAKYTQQAQLLIEKTDQVVSRCLRSMGLQLSDIQNIILIGGTSNSKLVYNHWIRKTTGTSIKVIYHQPLSSVARGAALYAQSLIENNNKVFRPIELKSVSTYNIGTMQPGNTAIDLLIHRNTPLPVIAKRRYTVSPANSRLFCIDVCQYWDEIDPQILGTVQLDTDIALMGTIVIELILENKANGTIGLKLQNAENGKDIRFSFVRKRSGYQYNFQQQKNLLDGLTLNNIG